MHLPSSSALLLFPLLAATASTPVAPFQSSSKRGLVYVATNYPFDLQVFVGAKGYSDLTWYYNYDSVPSAAYANLTQAKFEFVPMLWGAPAVGSTVFTTNVQNLIKSGRNITNIMAFNEPDGTSATGGSNIDATTAAAAWISNIAPLQRLGIKAGAPAVTGSPQGFTWLTAFYKACTAAGTPCSPDFIPVHWYGNFEGLASHLGQMVATYPNTPIWVTEYAENNASLADAQSFFQSSAQYFDRLDYVKRYSYFGSFRSTASNVGKNAAMLDGSGSLTDIGSWYLGGAATGVVPNDGRRLTVPSLLLVLVMIMAICL